MILIWLGGGPATIDMWDPKPEASEEVRGEFRSIRTALPGVYFTEHLPRTAEIADRCLLIRSLHHNIPDHAPGTQYMMTGNKPSAALTHPSVGSLAASLLPSWLGMPPYFTFGRPGSSGAGFLGAAWNPFEVEDGPRQATSMSLDGVTLPEEMTVADLEVRRRLRDLFDARFQQTRGSLDVAATLGKFQHQAVDILTSDRIGKAFDFAREPASILDLYGASTLGRNALIGRRLLEAGARFVTIGTTGWDTHSGNFTTLRGLLPPLDRALAALILDLDQRGLLDETIVCCAGEFGRTPRVNGTAGRDHWSRAMSVLLAGGGLRRGYVYGSTDAEGGDPASDPCTPDDLAATLLAVFGFGPTQTVMTTSGRPIEVFKNGRVLEGLMEFAE